MRINLTISGLKVSGVNLSPFFTQIKSLHLSNSFYHYFSHPMVYNSYGSINHVSFKYGLSSAIKVDRQDGSCSFRTGSERIEVVDTVFQSCSSGDSIISFISSYQDSPNNIISQCTFNEISGCQNVIYLKLPQLNATKNCFLKIEAPNVFYFEDFRGDTRVFDLGSAHFHYFNLNTFASSKIDTAIMTVYPQTSIENMNISGLSKYNRGDENGYTFFSYEVDHSLQSKTISFHIAYSNFEDSKGTIQAFKKGDNVRMADYEIDINLRVNQLINNTENQYLGFSNKLSHIIVTSTFFINNVFRVSPFMVIVDDTNSYLTYFSVSNCHFTNSNATEQKGVDFSDSVVWESDSKTYTHEFLNNTYCIAREPNPIQNIKEYLGFRLQEIIGIVLIIIGMIALLIELFYKIYKFCCYVEKLDD